MRILHISLADPQCHGGGLNRFCRDLMIAQSGRGDDVFVLHPGFFLNSRHPKIVRVRKNRFVLWDGLPAAITYGIDDPSRYLRGMRSEIFRDFFWDLQPDIIHVHSIQGIPICCFQQAKEMGIPIVYTTHDYYVFCPRGSLLDRNGNLCTGPSGEKCARCNLGAGLSAAKQRLLQSEIYGRLKDYPLLRKRKNLKSICEPIPNTDGIPKKKDAFETLLEYNRQIMNCFSVIHCNSTLSQRLFWKVFPNAVTRVVPISHGGIIRQKRPTSRRRHIGYLGGPAESKGWRVLMDAVERLETAHTSLAWSVWMYGGEFPDISRWPNSVHACGAFSTREQENVWGNIDILVVPSTGYESFGFVVPEALSRGIPTIVSDLVGAKELLPDYWVYPHDRPECLASILSRLMDNEYYARQCETVQRMATLTDIRSVEREIRELYGTLMKATC